MQGGRSAEGGGRKECRRGREEGVQKGERGCGGKECRRGRGDAGGRSAEGGEGMGGKECRKGRGDADFQNSMTSQFTVLVLES